MMKESYETLAVLLEYPDEHSTALLCATSVSPWLMNSEHKHTTETQTTQSLHTEISTNDLREFVMCVERYALWELQELYTRTFDLNPACALEVGYHLFGENYKRGEFLANLRETEAPFDLGQNNQLPDYLPVLLRLLSKLDDDLRSSLISECLIPAIEKMLTTFKDATNPYHSLLEVVRKRLQAEPGAQRIETSPSSFHMRANLPVLNASFMETKPELF